MTYPMTKPMTNLIPRLLFTLIAAFAVPLFAQPALVLSPEFALPPLEPGQSGKFSVSVQNSAATAATDVQLTVTLPAGGTLVSGTPIDGQASCAVVNGALTCTEASLAQNDSLKVEVAFLAPQRTDGENMHFELALHSAETDVIRTSHQTVMFRYSFVTSVADDGPGSLRQAIHEVNGCPGYKPCAIVFNIPAPVPAQGWFTILPTTPLPEITGATLRIDGRKQTLFTGDTNPDGPEIEISGALLREQSGLRVQPNCLAEIRNLAVNHFPGYGILIRRDPAVMNDHCVPGASADRALIFENYLGTDPRGRIARPNNRGLGVFAYDAAVADNLISGNRRAGIFIEQGVYQDIRRNRIGVAADGSALGNGAGIFVNLAEALTSVRGADITGNVIAYNDGMAIARTRRSDVFVSKNSIFDNLQQGIDVDLDGPSAQRDQDVDVPNAPVLFGATYDPVQNATIVRGRIDSDTVAQSRAIEVYASARLSVWSTPQAEQSVMIAPIASGSQDLELVVPGDLRGKWITATYNVVSATTGNPRDPRDSSELSNAIVAR